MIIAMTLDFIITLFVAPRLKGAGRWIDFGGFSFQPADVQNCFDNSSFV